MRIALYGGSYNPPHLGHREVAELVSREAAPDRLIVMPDNIAPHKQMAENSPSPEARLRLCQLNFRQIPNLEVSDMEICREGKSYTAHTVERMRELYPEDELCLVLGTDMLATFEQWYRFEYLLANCTLIAVVREADDTEELKAAADRLRTAYGAKIEILPHSPIEISSSEIRKALTERKGREFLHPDVYEEIIRHRYYGAKPELSWLRERCDEYLTPKRIPHVRGCEEEAVRLAVRWGADPETAAEAGILHDITKKCNAEEQLLLSDKYDIKNCMAEKNAPKLLHAKTGAALSRDLFGVTDEVYSAIRWHTTAKPDMTLLEKIIYLADYIEPTRDFPGVEELRTAAYLDIDRAMELGLFMSMEDIRSYGTEPYIDTVDAWKWYHQLVQNKGDE